MRYYVSWRRGYDIAAIKRLLAEMPRVRNVRTAFQYGWSNQPKVVTFTAPTEIKPERNKIYFNTGLLTYDKDWR